MPGGVRQLPGESSQRDQAVSQREDNQDPRTALSEGATKPGIQDGRGQRADQRHEQDHENRIELQRRQVEAPHPGRITKPVQLRGRRKVGVGDAAVKHEESLGDAERHGVEGDGPNRQERAHDDAVELEDGLDGGLTDETLGAETGKLAKRVDGDPWPEVHARQQSWCQDAEDGQAADIRRE